MFQSLIFRGYVSFREGRVKYEKPVEMVIGSFKMGPYTGCKWWKTTPLSKVLTPVTHL